MTVLLNLRDSSPTGDKTGWAVPHESHFPELCLLKGFSQGDFKNLTLVTMGFYHTTEKAEMLWLSDLGEIPRASPSLKQLPLTLLTPLETKPKVISQRHVRNGAWPMKLPNTDDSTDLTCGESSIKVCQPVEVGLRVDFAGHAEIKRTGIFDRCTCSWFTSLYRRN